MEFKVDIILDTEAIRLHAEIASLDTAVHDQVAVDTRSGAFGFFDMKTGVSLLAA